MNVLVTGAAGFIGQAVCRYLLQHTQCTVTGLDNLNDYYSVKLKKNRIRALNLEDDNSRFVFLVRDIAHTDLIQSLHSKQYDLIIHLAAQAGVRYSIENPHAYAQSNLLGFTNILELARAQKNTHLVYASSSSVYGANNPVPFSETANTDYPASFYAATKKSNEVMAASYAHLYGLSITGLRFFTVYGPWGRPDMAPWLFTDAILNGQSINVFNHGKMLRDFTYIDDIVKGIWSLAVNKQRIDSHNHDIFNIGNHQPVELIRFIEIIEKLCGKQAQKIFLPMQAGDVPVTCADVSKLNQLTGFKPDTPLEEGIAYFINWFQWYMKNRKM